MALALVKNFSLRIGTKLSIMSGLGILMVLGMIATQYFGNAAIKRASDNAEQQSFLSQNALNAKGAERGMQTAVRDLRLARSNEEIERAKQNLSRYPLYSTPYRKAKERMAFTGSFGDKSWSRNSII
jgi:hypothetical protein